MAEEAVEEQKDGRREGRQHRRIDPSRRVLGQRITRTINDSHCLRSLCCCKKASLPPKQILARPKYLYTNRHPCAAATYFAYYFTKVEPTLEVWSHPCSLKTNFVALAFLSRERHCRFAEDDFARTKSSILVLLQLAP